MASYGRRDDAPPASTVFVGNLSYDLTDQDVVEHFSQVGPVKHVRIVTERDTGKPRGFGFIEFFDIPTAESAIRNLSGRDFKGRTIRIVYADGGPGNFHRDFEGPPSRPFEGPGGPNRRPMRDRVVGGDLAYHSSLGVATLLGAPLAPGAPADAVTHLLARRSRAELYDYLAQVQEMVGRNPAQARQILADHPQLTKALFQMQVILGMVSNPLGDVAPKGVAPPNLMPRHEQHGQALQPQAPPGAGPPLPNGELAGAGAGAAAGRPQGPHAMELPPGAAVGPPMHGGPMQGPPISMQGPPHLQLPPMGMPGQALSHPSQQTQYIGASHLDQPPFQPPPAYMPPSQQQAQQGPYLGPPDAGYGPAQPADPRRVVPGGAPPRPMMSLAAQPHPQQHLPAMQQAVPPAAPPSAAMPTGSSALTPDQQQALLQQVMSLTPQQIELLPPQQKAQVLALQQQMGHR